MSDFHEHQWCRRQVTRMPYLDRLLNAFRMANTHESIEGRRSIHEQNGGEQQDYKPRTSLAFGKKRLDFDLDIVFVNQYCAIRRCHPALSIDQECVRQVLDSVPL